MHEWLCRQVLLIQNAAVGPRTSDLPSMLPKSCRRALVCYPKVIVVN
jgi:hypothetical protein